MKMITEVKIFEENTAENLERQLNSFLQENPNIAILNVEYQTVNGYSVLVMYQYSEWN